jgi:hypothetical protein
MLVLSPLGRISFRKYKGTCELIAFDKPLRVYSGSPPWILSIRKPTLRPPKIKTIHRIAPLNNILSALMAITPVCYEIFYLLKKMI